MAWWDWRRHHKCSNFDNVIDGQCSFCRINNDLILKGYEVIPFDIPGPYRGKGESPDIILQPIRVDPMDDEPS